MLGPGSHVDVTLSFMRVRVMCRPFLLRSYVAEVSRERSGISFVVMEAFIAVVFIGCVSGKSALGLTVLFFFFIPVLFASPLCGVPPCFRSLFILKLLLAPRLMRSLLSRGTVLDMMSIAPVFVAGAEQESLECVQRVCLCVSVSLCLCVSRARWHPPH